MVLHTLSGNVILLITSVRVDRAIGIVKCGPIKTLLFVQNPSKIAAIRMEASSVDVMNTALPWRRLLQKPTRGCYWSRTRTSSPTRSVNHTLGKTAPSIMTVPRPPSFALDAAVQTEMASPQCVSSAIVKRECTLNFL